MALKSTRRLPAERQPQPVHHQRPAVGDGDAVADPRGPEVLPALQHLEQDPSLFSSSLSRAISSLRISSFVSALEVQVNGFYIEKISQDHLFLLVRDGCRLSRQETREGTPGRESCQNGGRCAGLVDVTR
jgi:hypothetical protein